jgi:hypothetical protein
MEKCGEMYWHQIDQFSRQTFLYGIFTQASFNPLWDKDSSRREAKKGNRQGFLY